MSVKRLYNSVILDIVIIIIVILGLILRFYIAKNGIGYHHDDYMLLRQVMYFSYFDTLTKPLNYDQVCGSLFILTLKFFYSHFGLNHFILGLGSLISSCLALIFMPLLAYRICKNRFAALITSLLLAFNLHVLYYTQRIKQYSTDIFLTILLILTGQIFFSKPVTNKKMAIFTIFCIICGLFSLTANIVISCLIFYYLFFFEKDNIKTKITNFLIFIIPYLIIFVPFLISVGIQNVNDSYLREFWQEQFYINNFGYLKELLCYLFGGNGPCPQYDFINIFTFCKNFWYLFIPVIMGVVIIFIKKDKYLLSMLILPVIIAQFLGIMHIYPFGSARVSLWIYPIFLILFVIPASYIKFDKKVVNCILSCVIILYYLCLFDKSSIMSIKNFFNGYNFRQISSNIFVNELKKSDITDNDVIIIEVGTDNEITLFDVFDKDGILKNVQKISAGTPEEIPFEKNIYFYIFKEDDYTFSYRWVKENMDIIYEYETYCGDKFIKAKRKNNV